MSNSRSISRALSVHRRARLARTRLLGVAVAACGSMMALPAIASAVESCPNEAFRSGASAHLPDCRAYEMVTPNYKNGGVFFVDGVAKSGERLIFESFESVSTEQPDFIGASFDYAERTPNGWHGRVVDPPSSEFRVGPEYLGLAALFKNSQYPAQFDLETGASLNASMRSVPNPANPTEEPANAEEHVYVQTSPSAPYVDVGPLSTAPEPKHQESEWEGYPFAASEDLTHVFFYSPQRSKTWPFEKTPGNALFEYVGTHNKAPLAVAISNHGDPPVGEDAPLSNCGEGFDGVSAEGSIVYFTVNPCETGPVVDKDVGELYARIDNGTPQAHSVDISEPTKEDCSACDTEEAVRQWPSYHSTSSDGSKVFFTTSQPLLGSNTEENIYEYNFEAPAGERVTRLTTGDSTVSKPSVELKGLVKIARTGSRAYFVAGGVLTTTPNSEGQVAEPGGNNLYVVDTESDETAFIGTLGGCGEVNGSGCAGGDATLWGGDWYNKGQSYPDAITPNGEFLVFGSFTPLTFNDTSDARQLFEYDAKSRTLTRVSVGADAYNFNGNSNTAGVEEFAGPYVSNDGSYIFFQDDDALTPKALQGIWNVYEYHDGEVHLISDGNDIGGSQLVGASASGRDVFFTTTDALVPTDVDNAEDVYDARIDGGIPEPYQAPECVADSCQGQLTGAPVLLSPGSEFQQGGENFTVSGSTKVTLPKGKGKATKKSKKHKTKGAKHKKTKAARSKKRDNRTRAAAQRRHKAAGRSGR